MRRGLIALTVILAGCGSPPPRDFTWFEAHPNEASRVANACTTGARSNECGNARTAIARLKSKARVGRYRKGFE